ncbi:MAG: LysR family transcriptional regulator [Rhizobiales bacterium]|nr:LysR family transcriptional regulator [Hyphomicrobiales bacterium]
MDRLRAMSVFVSVVERGSFAAAAEHLGLSRTAVSRHVMELEAHLGVTLLNRTTRRVSLTVAGTAYFERTSGILEEIEEADNEAATQTNAPHGRVRVSAPMSFGILHIAPRLRQYMDAYPDVMIDLALNDRKVDLIEEGFDLTVRIGQLDDSSLISRKLSASRVRACAAPEYLENHGNPSHPDQLKDHICLCYSHWSGNNSWQFTGPDGGAISVPLNNRLWSNNGDALLRAAVSGLGIIYQPDFIAYDALRRGELVEILDGFTGPEVGIYVLYGRTAFMPTRVRTFIDFLVHSFARDVPWASCGR